MPGKRTTIKLGRVTRGVIAGAVGTLALDVSTYLDMVVRGRPSSELPKRAASELATRAGVALGEGDKADNRRSALGALLGYATGTGVGGLCGLLAGNRRLPLVKGGLATGAAAMACADGPMVALGLTDPTSWAATDWLADVVPHLSYGLAFAFTWDLLAGRKPPLGKSLQDAVTSRREPSSVGRPARRLKQAARLAVLVSQLLAFRRRLSRR